MRHYAVFHSTIMWCIAFEGHCAIFCLLFKDLLMSYPSMRTVLKDMEASLQQSQIGLFTIWTHKNQFVGNRVGVGPTRSTIRVLLPVWLSVKVASKYYDQNGIEFDRVQPHWFEGLPQEDVNSLNNSFFYSPWKKTMIK